MPDLASSAAPLMPAEWDRVFSPLLIAPISRSLAGC
jgi:hypothetical protein